MITIFNRKLLRTTFTHDELANVHDVLKNGI